MGFSGTLGTIGLLQGTIITTETLNGSLTSSSSLTGALSEQDNIVGLLSSISSSLSGEMTAPIYDKTNIETYTGNYTVIPAPFEEQVLPTANKKMARNVTVKEIPYFQTSNVTGDTVYIGG